MKSISAIAIAAIVSSSNTNIAEALVANKNTAFTGATSTTNTVKASSRRNFFKKVSNAIGTTAAASFVINTQTPAAWAAPLEVSSGGLPEGAAQFNRVLKAKTDWADIGQVVETRGNEMSKSEWEGVMAYLRQLYQVGDDMKAISKGMYDPAKKKQAETLISELQSAVKVADGVARKQDRDTFLAIQKKCAANIEDFFGLLQDVPDEL